MAKIIEWSEEQRRQWEEWVASRPECVQKLCRELPPDRLYRLKTSGHRVRIYSYFEDGTVTVLVTGEYNLVAFERNVFGIKPEDLEECDLPGSDECLGAVLTETDEVEAFCKKVKESGLLNHE